MLPHDSTFHWGMHAETLKSHDDAEETPTLSEFHLGCFTINPQQDENEKKFFTFIHHFFNWRVTRPSLLACQLTGSGSLTLRSLNKCIKKSSLVGLSFFIASVPKGHTLYARRISTNQPVLFTHSSLCQSSSLQAFKAQLSVFSVSLRR